jgi:hypothetical protein
MVDSVVFVFYKVCCKVVNEAKLDMDHYKYKKYDHFL